MPLQQVLPLGEVSWQNFEKLCLRLILRRGTIRRCALYGVMGQYQAGIDFYAVHADGSYSTYQCRRVQTMTAASIAEAVNDFLGGPWSARSQQFTLCTSFDLSDTSLQDEIVKQETRLRDARIDFEPLGRNEILLALKDEPKIVFDFFGDRLAREFCGEKAVASLGRRLNSAEIHSLREDLRELYEGLFHLEERTGSTAPGSLGQRFVNLDVVEHAASDVLDVPFELATSVEIDRGLVDSPGTERDVLESPVAPLPPLAVSVRRQPVTRWVTADDRPSLIVGGPGSGKSTTLRAIALDLLSPEPRFADVAECYGEKIPLWVPFSAWTRTIAAGYGGDYGVAALVAQWLRALGSESLQPLLTQALDDERLLLLVDGLDEFANGDAAEVALKSLYMHVESRHCALISAGRAQAIRDLQLGSLGWRIARLSPLSTKQQEESVRGRLALRGIDADRSSQLMAELVHRPEIDDLSETPLFLSHLTDLWLSNAALPATRSDVHEAVLRLLLSTHTRLRDRNAGRTPEPIGFNDDEKVFVLSALALEMQRARRISYSRSAMEMALRGALLSRFGDEFNAAMRRSISQRLFDEFVERNGILLQFAEDEFGFFHRSAQEYLVARNLAGASEADRMRVVLEHLQDVSWMQVLRSLLALLDQGGARAVVGAVESAADAHPHLAWLELVLSDTNSTETRLEPNQVARLVERSISVVEDRHWVPQRADLIRSVVRGVRVPNARAAAESAVRRWFPSRGNWQRYGFRVVATWSDVDHAVGAAFLRGLHSSDAESRLAAALGPGQAFTGGHISTEALEQVATRDADPSHRATGLLALSRCAPGSAEPLLAAAWTSEALPLRVVAAESRARAGDHSAEVRDALIEALRVDAPIEEAWSGLVAGALIEGWRGDAEFRDLLLEMPAAGGGHAEQGDIEHRTIITLLSRTFPSDAKVGDFLAAQLIGDHPFIGMWGSESPWQEFAANFRDHPALIEAADRWLPNASSIAVIERSYAALIGRTDLAKEVLLSSLDAFNPHWAVSALLVGWGIDDEEVGAAVRQLLDGSPRSASAIAHLLPEIEVDRPRIRDRLLELLRDPDCTRPDLVMEGFVRIGVEQGDFEVASSAFALRERGHWEEGITTRVLTALAWEPRARALALEILNDPDGDWASVASNFADDREIRELVLDRLTPLDSQGRAIVLDELTRPGTPHEIAAEVLSKFDVEEDANLATLAAIAHFEAEVERVGRKRVRFELVSGVATTGLHHEKRSQTAFAAALALDEPGVLADAKYSWSPERPVSVRVGNFGRPIVPLVRGVLENWETLHELYGDQFVQRLTDGLGGMADLWEDLVTLADEYPAPREAAMSFLIESGPTLSPYHQSPEVLAFLARVDPRGAVLRRFCVDVVTQNGIDLGSWQGEQFAAELLAGHFDGRPDVLEELRARLEPSRMPPEWWFVPDGAVCALADGWLDCDILDRAWELQRSPFAPPRSEGAIAWLWAARADAPDVISWIAGRAANAMSTNAPSLRARGRALRERFRRDQEVRAAASLMVPDEALLTSQRLSMLELLLSSGAPVDPDVDEYTNDLLVKLSSTAAEPAYGDVGFSVASGGIESLLSVVSRWTVGQR
jgi:hypothetical protein